MEVLLPKIITAAATEGRGVVLPLIDCFHPFGGQPDQSVSAGDKEVAAPVQLPTPQAAVVDGFHSDGRDKELGNNP